MKNKVKYLFFFLCVIAWGTKVYAYDNNTIFDRNSHSTTNSDEIKYVDKNGNTKVLYTGRYYVVNQNDPSEKLYAYCADPSLSAYYTLGVDHVLMSEESRTKAEDYALLTVMKHGMWKYEGLDEHNLQYDATSLAVRMFVNGILGWNYRHINGSTFPAYILTLYEWLREDEEMANDYRTFTGHDIEYVYQRYGYTNYSNKFVFGENYGAQVESTAKNIIKAGLKAGVEYKSGNIKVAEVNVNVAGGTEPVETQSGSITRYERLVVTEIELKNFNLEAAKPGFFNYLGFTENSSDLTVTELGYSFTYSNKEEDYTKNGKINPTDNLVEILKNNDTNKVYIAFKVILSTADLKCNDQFYLKTKYYDETLLNGAILVPLKDAHKDYTDGQRFVIYTDAPVETKESVNVKMCDDPCDPTIELPPICEDGKKADADGNVTYEYKEGKGNITKCILKNNDGAGNSLKLNDSKYAASVSNNKYCSVYCKEDYKFTVPYKKTTTNGRYFTIGMSIKGQQDCYSTKLDTDTFKKDIIAKQKEIIDAYNERLKYYELLNNELVDSGRDFVCKKNLCFPFEPTLSDLEQGLGFACLNNGSVETQSEDQKMIEFKGTYYLYEEVNGQLLVRIGGAPDDVLYGSIKNNKGTCSTYKNCQTMGYTCNIVSSQEDYDKRKIDEDYQGKFDAATTRLDAAIEALKQTVDLYNSCMGDSAYRGYSDKYHTSAWQMIYLFEPKITYRYEEPNPGGTDTKYMDMDSCVGAACDIMIPVKEQIYSGKCSDEDKENNRCSEVSTVTTIFDNQVVPTTEYCHDDGTFDTANYKCSNPKSTITYEDKSYFMCEKDSEGNYSCGPSTYKVTDMSYVHKVATSEGQYDTPRVFYSVAPYGQIAISNTKVPNGTLIDGLPVGANTPLGDYYYVISIDGLGRYYNAQKTGRIFGTSASSLTTVDRLEHVETLNGEELRGNDYACTYKVTASCKDENGVNHSPEECPVGQDWNECKKTLCPNEGTYCVKEAQAYYVCETQAFDKDTCVKMNNRDEAISNSANNYNCCPNCQIVCVGHCIREEIPGGGSDLKVEFRPISPSIVNPNDRQLGYNWDTRNPINTLMAQKAGNTISEIEERANIDAGSATEEELKEIEKYTLKVKLTPEMASWIKEYNKNNETSGSYNNNTLNCYDYKMNGYTEATCKSAGYSWVDGACVMPNVFCYSSFIDKLQEEYPDEIDAPHREEAKSTAHENYNTYANINKLPNQGTTIVTNDYWTIYQYTNLDVNSDGIPDIGPSWK